ncbi:hypothetical protein ACFL0E_00610, partial [Nanoarchaeota archaeon]
ECKCGGEGCARCELKLTLKAGKSGYVYITDSKSADPKCDFVYPMPVSKLLPKQRIELQMTAILGKGREHTKWSPGWVYYFGFPEFKVTSSSDVKACEKCPALSVSGNTIKIKDISKWNSACEEICEKNNVKVEYSEKDVVFNVESWGQLSCKEMLDKCSDVLIEKLDEFEGML